MTRLGLAAVALLFAAHSAFADADPPPYRYAYFLFEIPTVKKDCSDCYIPLLISRNPLEKDDKPEVVSIVTYERDSIWSMATSPVKIDPKNIDAKQKQIRWEEKKYRYQLLPDEEVKRLLENPMGEIPISRITMPVPKKAEPLFKEVLRDFGGKVEKDKESP